jgi:hypothetical protein
MEDLLTNREKQKLIEAFLTARGDIGGTEAETARILSWAKKARVDSILLEMLLNGEVAINIINNEICFKSTGSNGKSWNSK